MSSSVMMRSCGSTDFRQALRNVVLPLEVPPLIRIETRLTMAVRMKP